LRIHLDGGAANILLGGEGAGGDIDLRDSEGRTTIHIDAGDGAIRINGAVVQTADYVFDPDYKLAPLNEVAEHIAARRHLPGIPSAAEMRAVGVDLVEMNRLLLTQVEELTLRLIDMDARLARLER
jgi:hypothetical protein